MKTQQAHYNRMHWSTAPGIQVGKPLFVTPEQLFKIICEHCEMPYELVVSKTRKREVVSIRQISMKVIFDNYLMSSLESIGAICGGKDHATVLHAKRTIQDQMDVRNSAITQLYISIMVVVLPILTNNRQWYSDKMKDVDK